MLRLLTNCYEILIGVIFILSIVCYVLGIIFAFIYDNNADISSITIMIILTFAEFIVLALLGAASVLLDIRNITLIKARLDYPEAEYD